MAINYIDKYGNQFSVCYVNFGWQPSSNYYCNTDPTELYKAEQERKNRMVEYDSTIRESLAKNGEFPENFYNDPKFVREKVIRYPSIIDEATMYYGTGSPFNNVFMNALTEEERESINYRCVPVENVDRSKEFKDFYGGISAELNLPPLKESFLDKLKRYGMCFRDWLLEE